MANEFADSAAPAVLDLVMLDQIVALGGMALLERLVAIFLGQLDSRRTAIAAASRGEEVEAGIRAAHSLKSTSAQFGLVRLARIAGAIEEVGRDGRPAGIAGLLPELESAAAAAGSALAAELDRRKESAHA